MKELKDGWIKSVSSKCSVDFHNLQVDIFSQQLLLMPIHLGVHWATIVVHFTKKEIVYYDLKMTRSTGVMSPCYTTYG